MEQLGRYLLDRKLAQGGMAEVFLAKQIGPGDYEKPCVVKRMLPHLSQDVTFIEMFVDEARLAARLAHPGIAQILDFGHEQDTYYLAMEYVNGQNLKTVLEHRLQQGKPVPLPVAARLTALVAQALDYAHHAVDEKGRPLHLIHRDVSPHNVMVTVSGDVKLIDFGIAKAATDRHHTVAGTLKGKYAYMSPEQLRSSKVDQRTDIYALGLVLYELVTGRPAVPPNDNMNALLMAAAQRRYAPVDQHRPETPNRLREILDRALALDPAARFQMAGDMADQLEEWLASNGVRVKANDLAALVLDSAPMTMSSGATPLPPPVELRHDIQSTMVSEVETLRDVPAPPELHEVKALKSLRETVASRRAGADRAPMATSPPSDPSMDPTPIVGTPAVMRHELTLDVSLMPTDPVKAAPDIAAVMARPAKQSNRTLVAVTEPSMPIPAAASPPVAAPAPQPLKTVLAPAPEPLKTVLTPAPHPPGMVAAATAPPRGAAGRGVLLILLLLPIGGVASAIEFLPKESPVRARLAELLAPLLAKLKR